MASDDDSRLTVLLDKLKTPHALSSEDLSHLITCFVPQKSPSLRSKAYLVLSLTCQKARSASQPAGDPGDDPGAEAILQMFSPGVVERLADVVELPLLEAFSFVVALFGVDARAASSIFQQDAFEDSMMDALELFPKSVWIQQTVSSVLAHACGYKDCRAVLSPRSSSWLDSELHRTTDLKTRETVALAHIKGYQGLLTDSTSGSEAIRTFRPYQEVLPIISDIISNAPGPLQTVGDAVEGLAYLSAIPSIKDDIVDDDQLMKKIASYRPVSPKAIPSTSEEGPTTVLYGVSLLALNLSTYRPRLTEEELQIAKLRRMASANVVNEEKLDGDEGDTTNDDDEHVRERGKRLIKGGVVDVLVAIVRATDSRTTRSTVGRALLNLVEEKENRGKILQAGGGKALMTIIQSSSISENSPNNAADRSDLCTLQALAKLAITASPLQVFGPNEAIAYDAVKPFTSLLLHSSSTLLQRFEAMMALTNLASAGPEVATRIAKADGVMNKVEFLLLDENVLVRRAATELLCNLAAGSEDVFNRFSGESSSGGEASVKSRLQIIVALSDVEDDATRMAASGTLATLTASPRACELLLALQLERQRVLPVLKQLIEPSPASEDDTHGNFPDLNAGALHRGVVCLRNLLANTTDESQRRLVQEYENAKLIAPLIDILRSSKSRNIDEAVLRPTAESLKLLMNAGIAIHI
ncbi:ARM repeat-containing protein [Rickenella mellea]|uniref:ARM repeat-containing protein n=1 Tax=Rickenella mellea TaxID=50990 RepID=A0A4Y7QMG3_9AGAM|nr:ARM repeat-containing protein [Rickenella mellea]